MHNATAFNHDLDMIRRHYRWIAPIYPFFELVFLVPRGIRDKAVQRLNLKPGDTVLEVGCGTGRNLRYLVAAVGAEGRIYGVDCSNAMLDRAKDLCRQSGWNNVTLLQEDAVQLKLAEMVDGVLFSLSYSVMPKPRDVLAQAWRYLRPGKRLVIMDGKLANGVWGRISRPIVTWLSQQTVLGNPTTLPLQDLPKFTAAIEIEECNLRTYYICVATKPPVKE
jgi:ubiquinone/menaquinone biosynthesis C-methylase UbiE